MIISQCGARTSQLIVRTTYVVASDADVVVNAHFCDMAPVFLPTTRGDLTARSARVTNEMSNLPQFSSTSSTFNVRMGPLGVFEEPAHPALAMSQSVEDVDTYLADAAIAQ